jgi:tRNA1Val (adenine37-N6)-methyltransferase
MASSPFRCKNFELDQIGAVHPVGTDGMLLGAWAEVHPTDRHVLDIGTGTGLIALMLAQRVAHPKAYFLGVEMHHATARCAARNFAHSPWHPQCQVVEIPVQDFAASYTGPRFDLIVSNPPFFTETTASPDNDRRLGRSAISLTTHELLAAVAQLLAPDGRFCVVLPATEARTLCEAAVPMGLYWTRRTYVTGRPARPVERWLVQLERNPYRYTSDTLSIYDATGQRRSAAFAALTGDFYL